MPTVRSVEEGKNVVEGGVLVVVVVSLVGGGSPEALILPVGLLALVLAARSRCCCWC